MSQNQLKTGFCVVSGLALAGLLWAGSWSSTIPATLHSKIGAPTVNSGDTISAGMVGALQREVNEARQAVADAQFRLAALGSDKERDKERAAQWPCAQEEERREACRACRPGEPGPGEQRHDTNFSCSQFCSSVPLKYPVTGEKSPGRCGSSIAHRRHGHDCRDRAARAASARATAEAWHADGWHERPTDHPNAPASLQVCYFELSACEYTQNPGAPWTVRVFLNDSKSQALCGHGRTMEPHDDWCKTSAKRSVVKYPLLLRLLTNLDSIWAWVKKKTAWLGELFTGPYKPPQPPQPISFMLEYNDDAAIGPTLLVENEWVEFTPRSAGVARVGIRAHTLDTYCGLHVVDNLGNYHYKDLDDNDVARRRAGGGTTLRIPTTAGLVVIEVGPVASFPKPAPQVLATRAPPPPPVVTKCVWRLPLPWGTKRARLDGKTPIPVHPRFFPWLSIWTCSLYGPNETKWDLDPDLRTALVPGNLPVTDFFHRASAAPAGKDKDITLCTQMDTLGLPFLPRLASQWGGPLSVVLYLVPWQTAAEVKQQLLSNPVYRPVLKHADIHLVKADLAKALFPINALRNLAIDRARTNLVWLIEADMLVPAGVRLRLMQEHLPRMLSQPDTAWVVPLFESPTIMSSSLPPDSRPVFQTKAELLADHDWKPCEYESHSFMRRREDGGMWNLAAEPYFVNITNVEEPYYVVDRRHTTRHDPRLGWLHPSFGYGPNADKLSQVREQRRLTRFKILPDAFLLRYPGWDRAKLESYRERWDNDHSPTPTFTRRYATFRDPDRACRLYHRMNRSTCP